MELKKIGILSLAKITGLFGVIYGFFSGILLSIVYNKVSSIPEMTAQLSPIMGTLGYWSILVFPLLNGLIYFIAGIVLAFVYNILAGWIGGVKLEFSDKKK